MSNLFKMFIAMIAVCGTIFWMCDAIIEVWKAFGTIIIASATYAYVAQLYLFGEE